jgi:hypothetical protein
MWKWLRSWFAWQFSLRRLVVAVVLFGAVVGLNVREIGPKHVASWASFSPGVTVASYWGWPLAHTIEFDEWKLDRWWDDEDTQAAKDPQVERAKAAVAYRLPLTHQTYRLAGYFPSTAYRRPLFAIIDALVAIIPLALILFLPDPSAKNARPIPASRPRWRLTKARARHRKF